MSPSGAPGVKTAATPAAANAGRSSSGMMPPANTRTSSRSRARSSSTIFGMSVMCAPDSTDRPTRVGVLLQRRLRHELGRLEQAGVHDLEPRVAQGPCDHFGPPIVSVQPGLGDDDAVASQHRLTIAKDPQWPPLAPAAPTSSCSSAATVGVLLAGFFIAGAAFIATRSTGSVVCGQLNIGSATDIRQHAPERRSVLPDRRRRLRLLARARQRQHRRLQGRAAAGLHAEAQARPLGVRRRRPSHAADLAQYPVSIQTVGQTDSVVVDLLPPARSRRRPRQPRTRLDARQRRPRRAAASSRRRRGTAPAPRPCRRCPRCRRSRRRRTCRDARRRRRAARAARRRARRSAVRCRAASRPRPPPRDAHRDRRRDHRRHRHRAVRAPAARRRRSTRSARPGSRRGTGSAAGSRS